MKTITLKQPWASLIAYGYKKYEFRTWKTNYRGEILIHAGKGIDKEAMKRVKEYNLEYPSGKIIAKVKIVDCIKLDENKNRKICSENRKVYGYNDYEGYAWLLSDPELVDVDEEVSGRLSFWEYNLKEKK